MLSQTEENYLKAIYHLSEHGRKHVSTNEIANVLQTKPASVSDMLKKLAEKKLINYQRYKGVTLADTGAREALKIIRKHRLWEVFLVEKLQFPWDEVHEIAEQLEHIKSPQLIDKLDKFLQFPEFDPHGDPIPNANGEFQKTNYTALCDAQEGDEAIVTGVKDTSAAFLKHLDKLGIYLGAKLTVKDKVEFDGTLEVSIDDQPVSMISKEVAQHIHITAK